MGGKKQYPYFQNKCPAKIVNELSFVVGKKVFGNK